MSVVSTPISSLNDVPPPCRRDPPPRKSYLDGHPGKQITVHQQQQQQEQRDATKRPSLPSPSLEAAKTTFEPLHIPNRHGSSLNNPGDIKSSTTIGKSEHSSESDSKSLSSTSLDIDIRVNVHVNVNTTKETSSSASSSTPSTSSMSPNSSTSPKQGKDTKEIVKQYRVDIHLGGKNHKFPGHFSFIDKSIITEWGRLWKHKKTMNLTMTVDDPRVVMCLRKNQQPQRWEQKEVYEWFQTKCIKLYNECTEVQQAALRRSRRISMATRVNPKRTRYFSRGDESISMQQQMMAMKQPR